MPSNIYIQGGSIALSHVATWKHGETQTLGKKAEKKDEKKQQENTVDPRLENTVEKQLEDTKELEEAEEIEDQSGSIESTIDSTSEVSVSTTGVLN